MRQSRACRGPWRQQSGGDERLRRTDLVSEGAVDLLVRLPSLREGLIVEDGVGVGDVVVHLQHAVQNLDGCGGLKTSNDVLCMKACGSDRLGFTVVAFSVAQKTSEHFLPYSPLFHASPLSTVIDDSRGKNAAAP